MNIIVIYFFSERVINPFCNVFRRWVLLGKGEYIIQKAMVKRCDNLFCKPLEFVEIYYYVYFIKPFCNNMHLNLPVMTVKSFTCSLVTPDLVSCRKICFYHQFKHLLQYTYCSVPIGSIHCFLSSSPCKQESK